MTKVLLTNEGFSEVYDNKFDLTLHMIDVAHRKMMAGEDVTLTKLIIEMRKEAYQYHRQEEEKSNIA